MSLVVVGIHERDVSLDVLGRCSVSDVELPKALRALCDSPHLAEAVIVSTCLRTEVYAVLERFHDGLADIQAFFDGRCAGQVADALYFAHDDAAASHLFEVAAGIDSAVLGEGEVLRQVRHAAERARAEQASGPLLAALFRHGVEVGKRVRSETAIARGITSISHAAVALAVEHLGGSLSGRRVVVTGAGEVGAGMLRALDRMPGRASVAVANRTRSRGAELARRAGGEVVPLEGLQRALREADVLLTSTAAPAPVVRVADLATVMVLRPERPLLVVDAAVPRDVEPESRDLPGVTLLDLDDIRTYAEANMTGRRAEVERARSIIGEEIERYRLATTGRSAAPLVSELRAHAESVRRAELERFRSRLGAMPPADRELVETLSKGIVAKLLHHPTVVVKEEAGSPRGERLAEALRALFDL